jgi:uncharacterized membrane protein (UPF0136 family)
VTLIIALYGLFIAIGGIIGYLKARSQASLISGLISAVALWIAAYRTLSDVFGGVLLADCIAVALLIVFAVRWSKTRKFMPAGLMTILSLIAAIVFTWALVTPFF